MRLPAARIPFSLLFDQELPKATMDHLTKSIKNQCIIYTDNSFKSENCRRAALIQV